MVRWGDMGRPRALFLAQNSPREVSSNLVQGVGFLDTAIGERGLAGKVQLLKDAGKGLLGGLGACIYMSRLQKIFLVSTCGCFDLRSSIGEAQNAEVAQGFQLTCNFLLQLLASSSVIM